MIPGAVKSLVLKPTFPKIVVLEQVGYRTTGIALVLKPSCLTLELAGFSTIDL